MIYNQSCKGVEEGVAHPCQAAELCGGQATGLVDFSRSAVLSGWSKPPDVSRLISLASRLR